MAPTTDADQADTLTAVSKIRDRLETQTVYHGRGKEQTKEEVLLATVDNFRIIFEKDAHFLNI